MGKVMMVSPPGGRRLAILCSTPPAARAVRALRAAPPAVRMGRPTANYPAPWRVRARPVAFPGGAKVDADAPGTSKPCFYWRGRGRPWQPLHTWTVHLRNGSRVAQAAIDQWPPFGDPAGELVLVG